MGISCIRMPEIIFLKVNNVKKGVFSLDIYRKLLEEIDASKILVNEPMKKHTSFKVGGPADFFVKTDNVEEIRYLLKIAKQEEIPIYIVGNGTNLLVRDKGIRGIVLKPEFQQINLIKKENDKYKIEVGSGVSLINLSNRVMEECLVGLEFAGGIPGTVGGAIRMNAGAYGSEMKDVVVSTTYMDLDGQIHKINNQEHRFEYRNSVFSRADLIIMKSELELFKGNQEEIRKRAKDYKEIRKEKQPLDKPSAGSTFKRGKDYITASLIEKAGLKGYSIGGAQVSIKHAGFIVNTGDATANNIMNLIQHVKNEVKKKFKVEIQEEVLIIGEE